MAVYAEYKIPADGFRIGRAFRQLSDVEVELERVVPTGDAVIPYVWVQGADPSDVLRVTKEERAVEQINILSKETDSSVLYRVVWNRDFRDTAVGIAEANITLLSGRGTSDAWRFEFRASNKQPLSDFQEDLQADGIRASLMKLYEMEASHEHALSQLTSSQLEALRLALKRGYFNEPRGCSLDELAAEVGITRQAFGGRLRRGIRTLLTEEFADATA
ncbi:helix-turn-helix domain-containing protein [Natrialbaceae archaeon A-CW2]